MVYFTPYEGNRPYIFVSYAHLDSALVLSTATRLHNEKYRIWYDEGIPAGTDWPKSVENHLRGSASVLFFRSANSLQSDNCFSEISTAAELGIPIYLIPLDDAVPEERWTAVLDKADCISDDAIESTLPDRFHFLPNEIIGGGGGSRKLNGWILVAVLSAILLVGTLVGAYGLFNGWFPGFSPSPVENEQTSAVTPEPRETVSPEQWESVFRDLVYLDFPDAEQKDAVQLMLGTDDDVIRTGDAEKITELYFCGSMALENDESIKWSDGKYYVRTSAPATGSVKDLSFISRMLNLEKLVLINQPADSIMKLKDLNHLKELNVSACKISTLENIEGFPALEILNIEHTQITDLTPLKALSNLKTVTVSSDMLPLILDNDMTFEVILAN